MDAIGVCMHKILRIIYGMLKNNSPFDPEIDRKNREKSSAKEKTDAKDSKRRYQEIDVSAPISRRQNKKRKEREQSQSDKLTKHEISAPAPLVGGNWISEIFSIFQRTFLGITKAQKKYLTLIGITLWQKIINNSGYITSVSSFSSASTGLLTSS